MKLLAYKINGQTINIDVFNWSMNQLNGNQPWIVSDTTPTDYADISSITSWYEIGFGIKDYLYMRARIREFYIDLGFVNLTELEKQIVCQLFIATKLERDTVYPEEYQKEYWNTLVEQSQQCRFTRWEQSKNYISYKLLAIDSSNLANDTSLLCGNYINYNITSIATNNIDGLFDYLQGTGNYTTNGYPSKNYWTQIDQDTMMSLLQTGTV
jgi:hypothetical protein